MKYATSVYVLEKGSEKLRFNSEKEASEFLKVARCSVASCYRSKCLCKGYTVSKEGITTHHETNTRLFKIWSGMKERCYRVNHTHYKDYGARGIKVCDEWLDNFISFKTWALSNGYDDTLTLDRVDVNGNYEPSNCKWSTVKEQMNNKRNNHKILIGNNEMTISQISEKYNIPKSTVRWRANNMKDVITGADMREPTE